MTKKVLKVECLKITLKVEGASTIVKKVVVVLLRSFSFKDNGKHICPNNCYDSEKPNRVAATKRNATSSNYIWLNVFLNRKFTKLPKSMSTREML